MASSRPADLGHCHLESRAIAACAPAALASDTWTQSQRVGAGTLGPLTCGVVHDLGNLLTVLLGSLDLLRHDVTNGDALAHASEAARSAAVLTRELLAIHRAGLEEPVPLALRGLVEETLALTRPGPGIRIATAIAPDAVVLGRRQALFQVVLNLLLNAYDAMAAGGTVTIRAVHCPMARLERDGASWPHGGVCLSVEDTGVGMDASVAARFFEPFFTTKPHGWGMGGAIVAALAREHGGWVTIGSRPGAGTTVVLHLPAAAAGDTMR